jgi:hypothetical protein
MYLVDATASGLAGKHRISRIDLGITAIYLLYITTSLTMMRG